MIAEDSIMQALGLVRISKNTKFTVSKKSQDVPDDSDET